jgi:hypothetical protein
MTKLTKTSSTRGVASMRRSSAIQTTKDLAALVERVVAIIEDAQRRVVRTVNSTMVLAYWHVGREIVEFVQRGARGTRRAGAGGALRGSAGAGQSRLLGQESAKLS